MDFGEIIGLAILLGVGIVFILFGLLIWKKQRINLIHSYHHDNVKIEDVPAYTRLMGKGVIIIGIGICLSAILDVFCNFVVGWVFSVSGFICGLTILFKAQKRYN